MFSLISAKHEHFSLSVFSLLYILVILNFSTLSCLLVPKACLNSELIENDMQWIVWYEMSV